jgi:alpha-L-fucosidase 2
MAVEKRLVIGQESQSGWSLAHMSNIWARLHDGDHALGCIEALTRSCVGPNLFTYHNDWRHMGLTLYWDFIDKIFKIDANFGLVAGVLEMLVFSRENEISILPALPKKWKRGYVRGVATRAGAVVSVDWDVGIKHLRIDLAPKFDTTVTIQVPGPVASFSASMESTQVSSSPLGKEFKIVSLRAGKAVEIEIVTAFGTRS